MSCRLMSFVLVRMTPTERLLTSMRNWTKDCDGHSLYRLSTVLLLSQDQNRLYNIANSPCLFCSIYNIYYCITVVRANMVL